MHCTEPGGGTQDQGTQPPKNIKHKPPIKGMPSKARLNSLIVRQGAACSACLHASVGKSLVYTINVTDRLPSTGTCVVGAVVHFWPEPSFFISLHLINNLNAIAGSRAGHAPAVTVTGTAAKRFRQRTAWLIICPALKLAVSKRRKVAVHNGTATLEERLTPRLFSTSEDRIEAVAWLGATSTFFWTIENLVIVCWVCWLLRLRGGIQSACSQGCNSQDIGFIGAAPMFSRALFLPPSSR